MITGTEGVSIPSSAWYLQYLHLCNWACAAYSSILVVDQHGPGRSLDHDGRHQSVNSQDLTGKMTFAIKDLSLGLDPDFDFDRRVLKHSEAYVDVRVDWLFPMYLAEMRSVAFDSFEVDKSYPGLGGQPGLHVDGTDQYRDVRYPAPFR
jgi:hypothetical protein